jgi:hypothetical protein
MNDTEKAPDGAPAAAEIGTNIPEQAPPPDLDDAKKRLAAFFDSNPAAELAIHKNALVIKKPWGDDSLMIGLPDEADLMETLNHVHLPKRFSAIWHRDSKDLEFIWTAFPLSKNWSVIPGRKFVFKYNGQDYQCEFGTSSNRLLTIAKNAVPIAASSTNLRNLNTYAMHAMKGALTDFGPKTDPRSFWVRGIEWDENQILDFSNHLNFFLSYYDSKSPTIQIHSEKDPTVPEPHSRYVIGKFPDRIEDIKLDDVLLQLWEACRNGDEARRFLYCYRILEYASFSHLDVKARAEIRYILSRPHATSDINNTIELVATAVQKAKQDDIPKFKMFLEEAVPVKLLWREIEANLAAFSAPTHFDGGFVLKALCTPQTTDVTFAQNGISHFADRIREMRNALAHGKDQQTAGVITPSIENFAKIRPWLYAISTAAAEVILFKANN